MELKRKGETAGLKGVDGLTVAMKWTTAVDFDLAVFYEDRSGRHGLVYFGELGDLETYPFMALSEDQGSEAAEGAYGETVRISRPEEMASIWFLCWDYEKVQNGSQYDFKKCDIVLEAAEESGAPCRVAPIPDEPGNILVLASLTSVSPGGFVLRNDSRVGTLHGLTRIDDLIGILGGKGAAPVVGRPGM